jgi:hypothetical protein
MAQKKVPQPAQKPQRETDHRSADPLIPVPFTEKQISALLDAERKAGFLRELVEKFMDEEQEYFPLLEHIHRNLLEIIDDIETGLDEIEDRIKAGKGGAA